MLIFGHIGITLGAAALFSEAVGKLGLGKNDRSHATPVVPDPDAPDMRLSKLASLGSRAETKFLVIGSLLPDIIDKPVGHIFFRQELSNGRIYAHTLLFLLLISLAGAYIYRRHARTWLLLLSFGTMMHLVLDQMWHAPQALLWPLYGFNFARIDLDNFIPEVIHSLFTDPTTYVSELVGLAIVLYVVWASLRRWRASAASLAPAAVHEPHD